MGFSVWLGDFGVFLWVFFVCLFSWLLVVWLVDFGGVFCDFCCFGGFLKIAESLSFYKRVCIACWKL